MNYPRISLEQWRTLVCIVEAGGYAQAAAQIHKSQSTLSHAIQQLERLIGANVFAIQGRKAVLTPTGEVLYRRGKALVDEALQLERTAHKLAAGWEPEIRLAVEILFPGWLLLRCLEHFTQEHPDIRLEIYESVLSGTDEALEQGKVDLAIGGFVPEGFLADPLIQVRIICAAHPGHPLHQLGRPLTLDDLNAHRQLVIRDSGSQRTRKTTWISEQRWTVSHQATVIRAAVMGLGYAWFPEESIREELDAGKLKPLPLQEGAELIGTLYLMYADREAAGPGGRRLAELLHQVSACVGNRCHS
ncbi:LysR family transcriptional regulator [Candidatus Thiothrix sp. Deng01]|uniref:LysR family transcriptional regulator n=1 Tax=Candidatus Thiothrix phosphatis TaxID=3112415 RepID=A0ABU6CVR3_9GAMM|nr:LysR family transcriptional regulator [Candidatus Thiothrix sp. Deng01]MEB4590920.1 LysR family transcriptional regulator [Candidatus Thiothrix sp. Deng01]